MRPADDASKIGRRRGSRRREASRRSPKRAASKHCSRECKKTQGAKMKTAGMKGRKRRKHPARLRLEVTGTVPTTPFLLLWTAPRMRSAVGGSAPRPRD
eukprot:4272552-Pleurochrysis_carterae.AAC.4